MDLPSCWEINTCGRQRGGAAEEKMGACPAWPDHGHSCWTKAGTSCGGKVECTLAQKLGFCNLCEVYKSYSTGLGTRREEFRLEHPAEFAACQRFLADRASSPKLPAGRPRGPRAA